MKLFRRTLRVGAPVLLLPITGKDKKEKENATTESRRPPGPFDNLDWRGADIRNFAPFTGVRLKAKASKSDSSCILGVTYKEMKPGYDRDPPGFPWFLRLKTGGETYDLSAEYSNEGQKGDYDLETHPNFSLSTGFQAKGSKLSDFKGYLGGIFKGPSFHTNIEAETIKALKVSGVICVTDSLLFGLSGRLSKDSPTNLSLALRHPSHGICSINTLLSSKKNYTPNSLGVAYTFEGDPHIITSEFRWSGEGTTIRIGGSTEIENLNLLSRMELKGKDYKDFTCISRIKNTIADDLIVIISAELKPIQGKTQWGLEIQGSYSFDE